MKIALDLEGVLADTHRRFLDLYNERFSCDFSSEDINDWYFGRVREDFNSRHNIPQPNTKKFLRGYRDWEGFYKLSENIWRENNSTIPKLFKQVPNFLKKSEIEVDVVTSRKRVNKELKKWLKANKIRSNEHYQSLRVESPKHMLDYELFVDDNPNLHRELGSNKTGIIVDQPWNRNLNTENSIRINKIEDLTEVIQDVGSKI